MGCHHSKIQLDGLCQGREQHSCIRIRREKIDHKNIKKDDCGYKDYEAAILKEGAEYGWDDYKGIEAIC